MQRTYVIAEAGVNHNGDEKLAFELVDIAVNAGADAVKFQTFVAEEVAIEGAPKAKYQLKMSNHSETQQEMLKKLELSHDSHERLLAYCKGNNIDFLSTAFDINSLRFLDQQLDLSRLKVPSGEITNGPLLLEFAKTKKPLILSTGMSTIGDIELALSVIAFGLINGDKPSLSAFKEAYLSKEGVAALKDKVSLLHCTSLYPAPFNEVNLRAIKTMRHAFGLPVGYSDHTEGIAVPIAAVACGAGVLEKHFTIDKNLPGPDHKASLCPDELKEMVKAIREVEMALGNSMKKPSIAELDTLQVARRSLIAASNLSEGQTIGVNDIRILRPATGRSPMSYWQVLGERLKVDLKQGDPIEF
ncbi:MAG: N-acetylneuraminate synthase [Gammaproteobacteria bacterium]|nr:N-acetylneuraminate synthase [Gammaproteobacteria bacterium]MCH9744485.1 N-acetylneuraminate synthase [Gammaproteobacteria bacterium]